MNYHEKMAEAREEYKGLIESYIEKPGHLYPSLMKRRQEEAAKAERQMNLARMIVAPLERATRTGRLALLAACLTACLAARLSCHGCGDFFRVERQSVEGWQGIGLRWRSWLGRPGSAHRHSITWKALALARRLGARLRKLRCWLAWGS
jgi:hypothetical protein